MKMKLLVLLTLFAFMPFVNAEEYLAVDRDTQSSGVEITQPGEDGSWDLFYNNETGKFQVVYNITTEARDEITLDLSSVYALFKKYALSKDNLLDNCYESRNTGRTICNVSIGGIDINVDKESMESNISIQPGDSITFTVTIKNSSGKTYFYKEDSLTIATPKSTETDNGIIGFDGQIINKELSDLTVQVGYNYPLFNDRIINNLMDKALDTYIPKKVSYYVDSNGTLTKESVTYNLKKGEPIVKIKNNYFYHVHNYYIKISSGYDTKTMTLKKDVSIKGYAYNEKGNLLQYIDGLTNQKYDKRNVVSQSDAIEALTYYLKNNYNGDLVLALIDEFNKKYNTTYNSLDEFSEKDFDTFIVEIDQSYNILVGTIKFNPSIKYDSFYKNQISVVITNEEEYDEKYKDKTKWSLEYNGNATIANYMKDKVNGTNESKYKETEKFIEKTVGTLNNNESSSFVYGMNLDLVLTGNYYEEITFGHYASIKMVAKKGVVIINYVDENGKPLQESETVEYYYYEDYETKAASFEDYELIEVEGLEKGTIEQDETVVTYVYQFVMGEGGEEEKEVVQTGSEVDYSIMTSAFITISLIGLAIYTHKKQN